MTNPTIIPTATLANAWDNLWFRGMTGESTFANDTDAVFFFIFWVSTFFFVLLMGLMVYFAIKYRRRPGKPAEVSASHNTVLELMWSIIPTILMAIMFFWGLEVYLDTRIAPIDAEEINVTAQQWAWGIEYEGPQGPIRSQDKIMLADAEAFIYALPANRPVKFIMTSVDVIHSFYIPAFRMKRDVFPNRYSTLWVEPTSATHRYEGEGESETLIKIDEEQENFYLACTEYCGDQHSQMWGQIVVLKDPDYKKWLDKQGDTSGLTLIELAKLVRVQQGCNACHTVDGKASTGPTWKGSWGTTRKFADGGSTDMDINYIRESKIGRAHV